MRKRKRFLLAPASAVALVLAVAAVAYACTVWRGTMTVRGNHPSSGEVTVTGLRVGMTQTVTSGVAKSTKNSGFFLVSTGSAASNNKLPWKDSSGNIKKYYVKFYNSSASGPGYSNHTTWSTDCMAGGPGVLLGSVTLNEGGQIASVQYVGSALNVPAVPGAPVKFDLANGLNSDVSPAESAVCISDPGAAYGNQAPLTIL